MTISRWKVALLAAISSLLLVGCGITENRGEREPANAPIVAAVTSDAKLPTEEAAKPTPFIASNFNGERAFQDLIAQVELGPRLPGTEAHRTAGELIIEELGGMGWLVEEEHFVVNNVAGRNITAKGNLGAGPVIILGAHYDSRVVSDRSPQSMEPVPGANDGASGVAVLLELARVLELDHIENEIWLAFFDLEDQGSEAIPGLDYIEGSRYMAENLTIIPEAVIVVDMVGDADQQLPYEVYSDGKLRQSIWNAANELGFGNVFVQVEDRAIRDDHLPFQQMGIPAVDIIDFNYPYWHTTEDTVDKTSSTSLYRVGRTLEYWLEE